MIRFPETRMLRAAKTAPSRRLGAEIAIFLLIFGIGMAAQILVELPFSLLAWGGLGEDGLFAVSLFATVGTIAACLAYCLKFEKRPLLSLGLVQKSAVLEYVMGMIGGLALFGGVILVCVLSGVLSLSAVATPNAGMIVLFFFGYLVQGFSEELLCRSYLMVSLSRGFPLWVCVLTNALLFSTLHVFNPGITPLALLNIALFGVFASLYTLRRGSIWGIAAIHSMWNFSQGHLFGMSVSGLGASPSLLSSQGAEGTLANLIHGGSFGAEAGLAATVILSLGIGILWLCRTKNSEIVPVE